MKRVAFNQLLLPVPGTDNGAPEWIELISSGPSVVGFDGRTWIMDASDAAAIVAAFNRRGQDIVIDWEHASEHRAPKGLDAPAAGWIKALEARDGAVWGQVEWTQKAARQIQLKEYRFLSPVFLYGEKSMRVRELESAGLTNQPNLRLKALNRQQEETDMDDWKELKKELGLPDNASEADVIRALNSKLAAQQAAKPKEAPAEPATGELEAKLETASNQAAKDTGKIDLTRAVPRETFDEMARALNQANERLAALEKQDHERAVEAVIQTAKNEGKVTPATEEHYRALCQTTQGLESFKALCKTMPVIAGPSGLDGKQPEGAGETVLSNDQKAVCRNLGLQEEEFSKALNQEEA